MLFRREFRLSLSISFGFDRRARHVGKSLKDLMKNVQPTEDVEVPEDDLEDMVRNVLL